MNLKPVEAEGFLQILFGKYPLCDWETTPRFFDNYFRILEFSNPRVMVADTEVYHSRLAISYYHGPEMFGVSDQQYYRNPAIFDTMMFTANFDDSGLLCIWDHAIDHGTPRLNSLKEMFEEEFIRFRIDDLNRAFQRMGIDKWL